MISAFSFAPGLGSEPGAGWVFAGGAASHSDVWVVTTRPRQKLVEQALADDPELAKSLHVRYLDLPGSANRLFTNKKGVFLAYVLWQRRLRKFAVQLHEEVGFDVAHHVTLASDWQPCGLRHLPDVPLVWGPVGGATYQPLRLLRWLGLRGLWTHAARSLLTRVGRRLSGDPTARRAAVVVGMNSDVAKRFAYARRVVVEPNFALTDSELVSRHVPENGPKVAIFVGRLLSWKGTRLAVSALARPEAADWELHFYGNGPDRPHLERLAAQLGVSDRVKYLGRVPRTQVIDAMAGAHAMLFPSMHDSAGWVVGEASSVGCPVICLDIGGPPVMADVNAHVVGLDGDIVGGLAYQLQRVASTSTSTSGTPTRRWTVERLPELTRHWYDLATS